MLSSQPSGVEFLYIHRVSSAGPNPAAVQPPVEAFRTTLGNLNSNVAGSAAGGRREIDWDSVPDGASAPNALPGNFFNVNSPRGMVFNTPGTGFQVSATAASGTALEFGNLNPRYTALFTPFSPQRLFTALGSTVTDVGFFVPGSSAPATTSAFGAVFSDVDLPNATSLLFFDPDGALLCTFFVPPSSGAGVASDGLSFLGVQSGAGELVGRVRITSGNAAPGATVNESGAVDLVVMDDFIYAEPRARAAAEPVPGTALLVLASPASLRIGSGRPTTRRAA